jgi:glutathione S-transferase
MKFYSAPMPAPNPRRVRIFAAEKGVVLDEEMLDLRRGEHKAAAHVARNSLGQVPVLVLDDGTAITETVSICRCLDVLHPAPPLFGRSAVEVGLVDMWIRRIEIQLGDPTRAFWRHAHPATAALIEQYRDYGESNRAHLARAMRWLHRELARGQEFVAGDAFTMADIVAVTTIDFAALIGLDPLAEVPGVQAWHDRVAARASYAA